MKHYSNYKESGVPWLGMIPEHWEVKQLRNFIKLTSEKGYGDKTLLSVTREQGVIVRNIDSKEENHNFIPNDLSGYKHVLPGQFVINKMKSWQGSYGVSTLEGIVSPAYYVCNLSFSDKAFFSMAIRSKAYIPFFSQYSKGIRVDQWDLSPIALKSIPFIVPPLCEQRSIATYLEEKTTKIERHIAERKREIALLGTLRQAEIAQAVTRGLNPNAPLKESGIPWIGKIPEHWEVKKIRQCFQARSEKVSDTDFQPLSVSKQGIVPQLETACKTNNGENRKLVRKGDFVVNSRSDRKGSCGISAYDGSVTLISTVLIPRQIDGLFCHYLLRSNNYIEEFYRNGRGIVADLWTTRLQDMRGIYLPLPPLCEQRAIATYLEEKTTKIDAHIAELEREIVLLCEYKVRLVSDAVTGQICVTE